MTTDQKGAIAEAAIALAAMKLGIDVYRPLGASIGRTTSISRLHFDGTMGP
jgi:hypothetical protein